MKIIFNTFREARELFGTLQVDNTPDGCLYLAHEGSRPTPVYGDRGQPQMRYMGGTGRWFITDRHTGDYVSMICEASS